MKLMKKIFYVLLIFIIILPIFNNLSFATELNAESEAALLAELSTGKIIYKKN